MAQNEREIAENSEKIMEYVDEYIFQKHKFPSKQQITEAMDVSIHKTEEALTRLLDQKELYIVFGGEGKTGVPEVYLPKFMMQTVIMIQKRPEWISEYSFKERAKLDSGILELQQKVLQYDMFERLLYLTDTPLEEAIFYTLNWLEFKDVVHHIKNKDYADITFEYKDIKALVEVEGTTKQGDKQKVLQLDGWIRDELDKSEKEPEELCGIFIINHLREKEPSSRDKPLTSHALRYMRRYSFKLVTTLFLFEKVKSVIDGTISKDEARDMIWKGEEVK